MNNFHGQYAEKIIPHTVEIASARSTRKLTTRVMLNAYFNVRVESILSQKPADEERGLKRSTTLQIQVASANQLRRITGFGEMADKLAELAPGTIIEAYGNPLRSNNSGTGAPDGMEVIQLYTVSNEAYHKLFNEDLPLVAEAKLKATQETSEPNQADIGESLNTEHTEF